MPTVKKQEEIFNKILPGLEKAHKKLVESKKKKGTGLVIMKDGKIVKVKPE